MNISLIINDAFVFKGRPETSLLGVIRQVAKLLPLAKNAEELVGTIKKINELDLTRTIPADTCDKMLTVEFGAQDYSCSASTEYRTIVLTGPKIFVNMDLKSKYCMVKILAEETSSIYRSPVTDVEGLIRFLIKTLSNVISKDRPSAPAKPNPEPARTNAIFDAAKHAAAKVSAQQFIAPKPQIIVPVPEETVTVDTTPVITDDTLEADQQEFDKISEEFDKVQAFSKVFEMES